MRESELRRLIAEVFRWTYLRKLNTTIGGNVSARLTDDTILITPSSVPKHLIKPANIVKMKLDGTVLSGGVPSSEWRMHVEIYKVRDDVKAVVHTHSSSILALSMAGYKVDTSVVEARYYLGETIPEIPYHPPGSQELADAVARTFKIGKVNVAILKNHGVVAVGSNLLEALNRAEVLEHLAEVTIHSSILEIIGRKK